MKSRIVLFVLALFGGFAAAQDYTLTVPVVPPSEVKYTVKTFHADSEPSPIVVCTISVKTVGGVEVRVFNAVVPDAAHPSATILGVFTALDTAVAGESGNSAKKANARIIKYLADNGYFPAGTFNP